MVRSTECTLVCPTVSYSSVNTFAADNVVGVTACIADNITFRITAAVIFTARISLIATNVCRAKSLRKLSVG